MKIRFLFSQNNLARSTYIWIIVLIVLNLIEIIFVLLLFAAISIKLFLQLKRRDVWNSKPQAMLYLKENIESCYIFNPISKPYDFAFVSFVCFLRFYVFYIFMLTGKWLWAIKIYLHAKFRASTSKIERVMFNCVFNLFFFHFLCWLWPYIFMFFAFFTFFALTP